MERPVEAPFSLNLDVKAIKGELVPVPANAITAQAGADPELDKEAEAAIIQLMAVKPGDARGMQERSNSIDALGKTLQVQAAQRSKMLQAPIRQLSTRGADGNDVANALVELKVQVEALDPSEIDFSRPGWATRLIGHLPGIGTPLKRYFTKYEMADTVIAAILLSLQKGREMLERDNTTLAEDQISMRELTHFLERMVKLGQLMDQKLTYRLERDVTDAELERYVNNELIFPLRQRIMDLQQQLAVNQQGVLALEIVIRNNRELINGVGRAERVTVSALSVAVSVALALANQQMVLTKISALNQTTAKLIAGTARRLKEQGVKIHQQASSAMIDPVALKSAFADIHQAMDAIARYREEALPKMAAHIKEFDELTNQAEVKIQQMERGNAAQVGNLGTA